MAARRLTQSSIEWAKIAERVPEAQKAKFLQFKAKSDSYLRRMMSNPENPPKIDWAFYKNKVPIPGMVDNFQKTYESMQIPYPKDTISSQIEAQEKEVKSQIAAFKQSSVSRIESYKAEIEHIKSLLPYNQMTLEDFADAHPEQALNPLKKPTFWPHNPEEQLDYKPEETQSSHH